LTAEMVVWLLADQDELVYLEMPLPGVVGEEKAWKAVEKVGEGIEVLKVWDGWAKPTPVKRKAKGTVAKGAEVEKEKEDEEGEEDVKDEGSDIFEHPPSPLLNLVRQASHLTSLLLTAAVLPSAPSSESFELLLPHLFNLTSLHIEDTPSSGLRSAVQDALEAKKLKKLKTVTSFGMRKKRKTAAGGEEATMQKGKAEKRFDGVCEKRGIEWVIEWA
jgi:hypothetical protein